MKKTTLGIILFFIVFCNIVGIPRKIFAAQLEFRTASGTATDNKETIIEARIDPESKKLNVVEGTIVIQSNISDSLSIDILTDDSVLTIWPTPPVYSSEEKAIRFVGGTTEGISRDELLFRIKLISGEAGDVKLVWANGAAYLNDGKGTKDDVYSRSLVVHLNKRDTTDDIDYDITDKIVGGIGITNSAIIVASIVVLIVLVLFMYGNKKVKK